MIKAGLYKEPSYNQRTFCIKINPPDNIKTWFIEADGETRDLWWDLDITPQKFHWLVDEWNKGNIAKVYPHWWEKVDSRKAHINSLLQLDGNELREVLNYASFIWPHYRWATELKLDSNVRPLFFNGEIIRFVDISKEDAIEHNRQEKLAKIYRSDQELYGKSDSEFIADELAGFGIK
ncbi:MAG: hypothetical protein J6Y86_03265 [Pseudobutyrivibrio sp.]|nr:hypothetical protein [Pseudobutyrivibrio sp.]